MGTSHQLLGSYLKGLGRWQMRELYREADAIGAQAEAENRPMTGEEEAEARALRWEGFRALLRDGLTKYVNELCRKAERGEVTHKEIKILKLAAQEISTG
jgi:hypothetical protein